MLSAQPVKETDYECRTYAITNLRVRRPSSCRYLPNDNGTALEELKADIRNHGILEPIKLYLGMILDGRNDMLPLKQ